MSMISVNTVNIVIEDDVLLQMQRFGEEGYPEEVVGIMLGTAHDNVVHVRHFLELQNRFAEEARHYSYQISTHDWLRSEAKAEQLAMDVVGVFHTHPDHPSKPSSYDLDFALPNLIYVIASIHQATLTDVQAWRLREDRSQFQECLIQDR